MTSTAARNDGRTNDALRPVTIERGYTCYAPGSVLMAMGRTRVLCTAFVEVGVPSFLEGSGRGWLTAEYAMLPSSTPQRKPRAERPEGRSQEIKRLVGRSLRAALDFGRLGEHTITVDCDVLQADGGTRTAAITGAYVAVCDAVAHARTNGLIDTDPIVTAVAAVSAGVVDGAILLDLDYSEDSRAEVDFNVVMTTDGEFIELQGTAEGRPFDDATLTGILAVTRTGIGQLLDHQKEALQS